VLRFRVFDPRIDRAPRRSLSLALVLLAALPAAAQTSTLPTTTSVEPNIYPPALPLRKGPKPPALAFRLLGEVALPGPLPAGAPRIVGDRIEIATEGGLASAEAVPGAIATVAPADPGAETAPTEPSPWVLSLDGKRRYRTLPEGRLEAEKHPRFGKKEWKRDWSLRLTLVFRRVGDRWQIVHRHADPLVQAIPFDHLAELARGLDG